MTSNSNKWSIGNGVNTAYSSNGVTLTCSSWNGMSYTAQLTNPVIIEYEITANGGDNTAYINFWSSNNFSVDANIKFQTHWINASSKLQCDTDNTSYTLPNGVKGKYQYKIYSDRIELYKDSSLVKSYSTSGIKYVKFTSGSGTNRTFTFKDFKVKPL